MITVVRVLRLDRERWRYVSPASLFPAMAIAVAASIVIALDRFGGLIVDAPRAFFRLALVGVYGWLGLAVGVWLLTTGLLREEDGPDTTSRRSDLPSTVAAVGLAHVPLLVLGMVVFVAANLFEVLGPGRVTAVLVFVFWFPAVLTVAVRFTNKLTLAHATAVVAVPYLVWLATVGRHQLSQVGHLL